MEVSFHAARDHSRPRIRDTNGTHMDSQCSAIVGLLRVDSDRPQGQESIEIGNSTDGSRSKWSEATWCVSVVARWEHTHIHARTHAQLAIPFMMEQER